MRKLIWLFAISFTLSGCNGGGGSSSGSTNTTVSTAIPKLTDPLDGQASVSSLSEVSAMFSESDLSGMPNYKMVRDSAKNVLAEASYIDFQACLAESTIKNKDQSLSKEGKFFYIHQNSGMSGNTKTKIRVNAPTGVVESFELYRCDGSTQTWAFRIDQNTSGATARLKMIDSSGYAYQGDAIGTISNGKWTSKSYHAQSTQGVTYPTTGTSVRETYFDQFVGSIRVKEATHNSADTTNDHAFYGQIQTVGSSFKAFDYRRGASHVQTPSQLEATFTFNPFEALYESSWTVANTVLFEADMFNGTLPTTPSPSISFDASEVWDCSIPTGAQVYEYADLSTELSADFDSCNTKY